MGWISKAAKLAPKAYKEISMAGKGAKPSAFRVIKDAKQAVKHSRVMQELIKEAKATSRGMSHPMMDLDVSKKFREFIRSKSMRSGSPAITSNDISMARSAKKKAPKAYDLLSSYAKELVDAGRRRGLPRLSRLHAASEEISKATGIRPINEMSSHWSDVMHRLAKRGLLPAAAAGAGVAASRKPKAQGYKYGGMVKRSRKGC